MARAKEKKVRRVMEVVFIVTRTIEKWLSLECSCVFVFLDVVSALVWRWRGIYVGKSRQA